MARIRNIKPDFFMSEDIGALTVHARLLYVALWTHADTEGKMRFSKTALAAQCMPFEMDKFEPCLDELVENEHVIKYKSAGKEYLLIPTFTEHQRPHHSEKSKGYPDPAPIENGDDTDKQQRKDAREGKKEWEGEREEGMGSRERSKIISDDHVRIFLAIGLNVDHIEQIIKYRKSLKKPLKTTKGLTGLLNNFVECIKAGFKFEYIMQRMEEREWQSIELGWLRKPQGGGDQQWSESELAEFGLGEQPCDA